MTNLTTEQLNCLTQWDTPTICNALEIAAPQRRGAGFTVLPFSCLYPSMKPIIGYARTAKIRAACPSLAKEGEGVDRMDYYTYVASGTVPTLVVIEDMDPSPGVGAFWGEVNTAIHKGLGARGVITNGSYRDVDDTADDFQILGGMVGPSHAFVHAIAFGTPVTVHGMEVNHDDIIHADQHGAVVLPADIVQQIPDAVALMIKREAPILKAARAPGFSIEALRAAMGESADIH